jgi:ABC-type uncharacterized transport system permease subunit
MISSVLGVIFLVVSMFFVYRSFYGMRIEGSGDSKSAEETRDREPVAAR